VWDCIKESERLLKHLKEEVDFSFEEFRVKAKRTYFKINVERNEEKRVKLFIKQLKTFIKCINQVSNIVKKKYELGVTEKAGNYLAAMESLIPVMKKVYLMTERKEILKEKVPVEEKIFSIYEQHTDIIMKGQREAQFGHKINLGSGKSNLILTCEILEGNPKDSELYQGTMEKLKKDYGKIPEASTADGGFASVENIEYSMKIGIMNIVFNKIRGSMQNIVNNKWIENKLTHCLKTFLAEKGVCLKSKNLAQIIIVLTGNGGTNGVRHENQRQGLCGNFQTIPEDREKRQDKDS
jgi:IS5 family transposase